MGTSPSLDFQKFSRWYNAHCGVSLLSLLGLFASDIVAVFRILGMCRIGLEVVFTRYDVLMVGINL